MKHVRITYTSCAGTTHRVQTSHPTEIPAPVVTELVSHVNAFRVWASSGRYLLVEVDQP
jgi:hypothetical protein